jgi:hypothetical protein
MQEPSAGSTGGRWRSLIVAALAGGAGPRAPVMQSGAYQVCEAVAAVRGVVAERATLAAEPDMMGSPWRVAAARSGPQSRSPENSSVAPQHPKALPRAVRTRPPERRQIGDHPTYCSATGIWQQGSRVVEVDIPLRCAGRVRGGTGRASRPARNSQVEGVCRHHAGSSVTASAATEPETSPAAIALLPVLAGHQVSGWSGPSTQPVDQ